MLLIAVLFAPLVAGGTLSERRVGIGLKLFRATLAADLALADKADEQGRLLVMLFYTDDRTKVAGHARRLLQGGPIGGLPVRTALTQDPDLATLGRESPAAIFIAQPNLSEQTLARLVRAASRRHALLYSPFSGHVEQGVASGLFIAARVQPYVNVASLRASGIELKDFFMRVAKLRR